MGKKIIAQVEFDMPRSNDNRLTSQESKYTGDEGEADNEASPHQQVAGY